MGKFFVAGMLDIRRMVGRHHAGAFFTFGAFNFAVKVPFVAAAGAMMIIMATGVGRHIAQGTASRTLFVARFVT